MLSNIEFVRMFKICLQIYFDIIVDYFMWHGEPSCTAVERMNFPILQCVLSIV